MYSNTLRLIAINKDDQGITLWHNVPKETECLFSIFVYCRKKQPVIRLSISPCLSELFDDNAHNINSRQVGRSYAMQNNVKRVDDNIWLFAFDQSSLYCHLQPPLEELRSMIPLNKPSIIITTAL